MSNTSDLKLESDRTDSPSIIGRRLVERRYLSLREPAQFRPGVAPARAASLRLLQRTALAEWRGLYKSVGDAWHWHDRNAWPDDQLAKYLAQPEVSVYAVDSPPVVNGGLLELCTHPDGDVEIVYLGLIPDLFGQRLGGWLLGEAVRLGWERGATRIWLHTCTLDGPHALPNYLARGFTIDRTETYSIDDSV